MKNMLNITEKKEKTSNLIVYEGPHDLELEEPLPYVCFNKNVIAPDPKKTYGLFSRDIIPKSK